MSERVLIQRPHKFVPHANPRFARNTVWIEMTPVRIINQWASGFGGRLDIAIDKKPTYRFIAPKDLQEILAHTWTPYDSIQSRIASKVKSLAKAGADLSAITGTLKKIGQTYGKQIDISSGTLSGLTDFISAKKSDFGQTLSEFTRVAVSSVNAASIPKTKVDTPLYYENSERRRFTFSIDIVAETDPKVDVVDPIKQLMELSAPEAKGGFVNIEFPYIFHIRTSPKQFVNMKTAALVGVQPTWHAPYIDGWPSSVTCQFDFLDLSPVYRKTLREGGIINVNVVDAGTLNSSNPEKQFDPVLIKYHHLAKNAAWAPTNEEARLATIEEDFGFSGGFNAGPETAGFDVVEREKSTTRGGA